MNDDEYGDSDFDLDAAVAEQTLRELIVDVPEDYPGPAADVLGAVRAAVEAAWPDGMPPTAAELEVLDGAADKAESVISDDPFADHHDHDPASLHHDHLTGGHDHPAGADDIAHHPHTDSDHGGFDSHDGA